MSWSDDQISALRERMAEARESGGWISAAEARVVLSLIWIFRRVTMRSGWRGAPEGHLPTVGDSKRHGVKGFMICCARPNCGGQRRFSFDHFALPDDTVFVEIPKRLRFRCIRCDGRQVTIVALWPDPLARKP